MTSRSKTLAGLAALGVAACLSQAGFAQEPPAGPPPSADTGNGAGPGDWAARRQEHADERAKALHAILRLRPDQEAAFQAMQATMTPPAGMRDHRDRGAMAALTTPDRLDRMLARMAKRQAEFQRRAEAIKQFYAVLSPDQQRAFDALPDLMGGHHGPRGHGGPGGPGHPDAPHGDS